MKPRMSAMKRTLPEEEKVRAWGRVKPWPCGGPCWARSDLGALESGHSTAQSPFTQVNKRLNFTASTSGTGPGLGEPAKRCPVEDACTRLSCGGACDMQGRTECREGGGGGAAVES
jgi:hypothetical protein